MPTTRTENRGEERTVDGGVETRTQHNTVTESESGADGRSTSRTTGRRTVTHNPPGTSTTFDVNGTSETTSRTSGTPPDTETTADTRSEEVETGSDGSIVRTIVETTVVTTVKVTRRADPDGSTVTTTVTTRVTSGQRRRLVIRSGVEVSNSVTYIGPVTVTTTVEDRTAAPAPGSRQGAVQPLPPGTAHASRSGTWVHVGIPERVARAGATDRPSPLLASAVAGAGVRSVPVEPDWT